MAGVGLLAGGGVVVDVAGGGGAGGGGAVGVGAGRAGGVGVVGPSSRAMLLLDVPLIEVKSPPTRTRPSARVTTALTDELKPEPIAVV